MLRLWITVIHTEFLRSNKERSNHSYERDGSEHLAWILKREKSHSLISFDHLGKGSSLPSLINYKNNQNHLNEIRKK